MFVPNNAFIPTNQTESNINCNLAVRIERKGQAEVTTECSKRRQVLLTFWGQKVQVKQRYISLLFS